MADFCDEAQARSEADLARSLQYRKPVPTVCQCGEPCAVLSNGARARFCDDCLIEFQEANRG